MFPKIVVPQNGLLRMENLIKMDDLGIPLFSETPIYTFYVIITMIIVLLITIPNRGHVPESQRHPF